MSTTRDTGFLRNVIQVHDTGVRIMSGSTMLMAVSSSGEITTTGVISGSNALSSSYAISGSYAVSSSYAFTASSTIQATSASKAVSASYSDTASFSNNFTVLGNLTVYGTQSIQYITSSQLNVANNVITVNVANPGVRFGGLSVFDSGSSNPATASLFWDSQNNNWIYQRESGSTYSGGALISGPRNTGGLGNEQTTTSGSLMKGMGGDHITSSAIFEDGYKATIYTNSLVVSSSGLVGIGITNPVQSLTVNGNVAVGGQQAFWLRDDDGFSTNTGRRAWAITANYSSYGTLSFFVANATASNPLGATAALNITSGGSVGIGTTSPSYLLDVRGSYSAAGILTIRSTDTATIDVGGVLGFGGFHNGSSNQSQWAYIKGAKENSSTNNNASYLSFATIASGDNLSTSNERMRITSIGNVGIGSTNPLAKLDLGDGNIRMGQYLNSASTYIGKAAAVNSNFYSSVQFYSTSGEDAIIFNTHLSGISAGERMRITGRGNVGIGTEPSAWATLTPIQIKNASFAGYSTGNTHILYAGSNFYYDGNGDKYISNGYASLFSQALGEHNWSSGPSNASGAGASLTLTGNMKLSQPGDLYLYNGAFQQQGVWVVCTTGYTSGASAFTFDVGVGDEGGGGNIFKVEAGFAHYSSMAYNCLAEFYISTRGTGYEITDVKRYDSGNGGSFTAWKPDSSTLRVAKVAGTYGGGGRYWIRVTKVNY